MSDGLLRRIRDAGRNLVGTSASVHLATVTAELPPPKPTPQDLHLRPGISASLSAVLGALRWGAVMIGLVFAATRAAGGDRRIVITVALAIFLTSMRTIYPLKLGDRSKSSMLAALGDVTILSIAIGVREGFANPLVGALLVAVGIVAFGWGLRLGAIAAIVAAAVTNGVYFFGGETFAPPSALAITGLAASAMIPGVVLDRLLESEGRRRELVDERDRLSETNQLLGVLNDLTRNLQSSLDQADVVQATRNELMETFDAKRLALLSFEDGTYSTLVQDAFSLPPSIAEHELPPVLQRASRSADPLWVQDLSTVPGTGRTGSGLYLRLIVRNVDTGLLAIEHPDPNRYSALDRDLLAQMSDVLALTLDNARAFNQLRSLAAAEERSKIARDLHDRLGQYLTYIALELERINQDVPSTELKELHEEVQGAVTEFRDTLLELRAAVSADRPLSLVLDEVVARFAKRSEIEVGLTVDDRSARLPARVENEFLRIGQEALTNVQKHAGAAKVHIRWSVADGRGVLVVKDDGRGFDPATGIRANAYGLVGMRERAAAVGALLTITSELGQGTAITVQSSQHPNR
ncbi:MAG: GAF domain-containing sensor histidine kinase [Actinomycetota bacterium]